MSWKRDWQSTHWLDHSRFPCWANNSDLQSEQSIVSSFRVFRVKEIGVWSQAHGLLGRNQGRLVSWLLVSGGE